MRSHFLNMPKISGLPTLLQIAGMRPPDPLARETRQIKECFSDKKQHVRMAFFY